MGGRRRKRGARLEMTSLMDVMFLVLVFFVYCVFNMSVHRGLKVSLPSAEGAREKGERVVITVQADDSLLFNGQPVSRAEAVERVRRLRRSGVDAPVLVSGDRQASLGAGVELLAELKAAGVESASFQVEGAAR